MADINVTVAAAPNRQITLSNPEERVIIGTPGVTFLPIDYRQGIINLLSGIDEISFAFSTPFVVDPRFGGDIIYNGNAFNDGYAYHVYNLSKTGCNVCLSDTIHTTGYQFHYYATAT
jgi:hypothetical protein